MTAAVPGGPDPRILSRTGRGCVVMQALQHPVPVTGCTLLNRALLTG